MFVLAEMQDVIRIEPHQFKFDMQRQIADELNKKLANKVDALLPPMPWDRALGLCVCMARV